MQPGETITPGAEQPPARDPQKQDQPVAPVEQASQPVLPTPEAPASNWQYAGGPADESQANNASPSLNAKAASWSASEYIAHAKGTMWFVLLGIGLAAFVTAVFLLTEDLIASIVVGIAGITFGAFAARPPRVLEYSVDARGIQIGSRFYPYADFKSFSLLEEGPLPAIVLLPLKRFLPPITVFYEPKEEDKILDVLADYLPHEEKQQDIVDRLMRHIRF